MTLNMQVKRKNGKVTSRGIEWCDATWNPVSGCFHGCEWTMPDGSIANCYAEDVADRVAQAAYPEGFEHHYWKPQHLESPLRKKTPLKIFVGSMADVFGIWVSDDEINQILDICRKAHWHKFIFLTKNAPRLLKFEFPENCWIGVSSPPDQFKGAPLSPSTQGKMFRRALKVLSEVKATVRWISFEPLSNDYSNILAEYPGAINWAVIGAASNGNTYYAPDELAVRNTIQVLDRDGAAVFFKGNLKCLKWAEDNWREEFPYYIDRVPMEVRCPECAGEGHWTCGHCGGEGTRDYLHACTGCHGKGKLKCPDCGGDGVLLMVDEVKVEL